MENSKLQNDITDFRIIYDQYCDEFYQIAISICGNATEAEDIVHDAFVKIIKNFSSLREKEKLENWMKKILVNTARTSVKKWWRKIESIEDQFSNSQLSYTENESNSLAILINQLQQIPIGYRNVFVLHAMQDIPQTDVATILGISVGTVKSQFFKAKKILRTKLHEIGVHNE